MKKQIATKNQEENFIFDRLLLNLDEDNLFFKIGEYCGEMDRKGEIINVIKADYITRDNDDTFIVCINDKYGLIDSNLQYLVEPRYDYIIDALPFYMDNDDNEKLQYTAKKDGKLGIIDRKGDILADFLYDDISDYFYNEDYTYEVTINDKHGILNTVNGVIIPVIYDTLYSADNDGYYIAEINGKYGIIDRNNNVVIDFVYDFLSHISGTDFNIARIKDKYGIIDNTGEMLNFNKEDFIKIYDEIESGKKNLNGICKEEKIMIIPEMVIDITDIIDLKEKPVNLKDLIKDKQLKFIRYVQGFNYANYGCICFNNGNIDSSQRTCLIFDKNLDITFFDKTVSSIIGDVYSDIFCIERNGLKGVINPFGREIIPCEYERINIQVYHPSIFPVDEIPIVVTQKNGQALFNRKGKKISKCYDSIDTGEMGSISEFFVVRKNDLYGVIDNFGNEIFMKKFDKLFFFTSEILFFKINSAFGVIDEDGEIIAEAKYKSVDILAGKYILAENFDGTIEIVEI